jgi:hypothetical protein
MEGGEMAKYRKKPVVIEAVQWTGDNIAEIQMFMRPDWPEYMGEFSDMDEILGINTLEGLHVARLNDWVIKGIKGEFYPCKPDIFEQTYEPVD